MSSSVPNASQSAATQIGQTVACIQGEAGPARQFVFGAGAAHVLRGIPADVAIIACDGTEAERALAQAAAFRRDGIPFFVAPVLHDREALLARHNAPFILSNCRDTDERRRAFEFLSGRGLTINGRAVMSMHAYQPAVLQTLRELCLMGDALLVTSQTQRSRLMQVISARNSYVLNSPAPDTRVPRLRADPTATRIVVWGPDCDVSELAVYLYALWEFHTPALVVCRGSYNDCPHEFFTPDRAEDALAQAAVVIDTSLTDPGAAIAFAGRGYGLATATVSGAHEYLQGAFTYDAVDFASIIGAAARARGRRRPRITALPLRTPERFAETLEATQPVPRPRQSRMPLISIVIPTYNRPESLQRCLAAYHAQSYANIEIIVVNDCGEDVAKVVAPFAKARCYTTPQNVGVNAALNFGLRRAKGDYVGFMADDDLSYPGHLARVAEALFSSGLPVAHANTALRLTTKLADGRAATYGYNLFYHNANDPAAVLWGGSGSSLLGYLIHRESFAELRFFDEHVGNASDCEALLKLSSRFDFAHVDCVTSEQTYRNDKSNASAQAGQAHADDIDAAYRRYLPPNRPLVAERQKINVDSTREAQLRPTFFSPYLRLQQPIPNEPGG